MRYYINYKDNLDEINNIKSKNSVGVIIAHYNEDLEWIDTYFSDKFETFSLLLASFGER